MLAAIIISVVIAIIICVGIFAICNETDDKGECQSCASLGFLLALCLFICAFAISEYFSPSITPMDVYQGKTTLEITYKDGVPIDSVVVFKD